MCAALVLAGCASDSRDADSATPAPTTSTTSAPTTTSSTPWARPACPDLALDRDAEVRVADPSLDEISGAALSSHEPGVVWVVEDSGNPSTITALSPAGDTLSSLSVTVTNTDWEDMAIRPGPDGGTIVVGDIGDNDAVRGSVSLVRVEEPDPGAPPSTVEPDVVTLLLPSPADAEALLVDPLTGDVVVVTKSIDGTAVVLVAAEAADAPHATSVEVVDAGTLDLGLLSAVLAGDVSPDGSAVGLRTPSRVLWWPRDPDRSIAETLLGSEPCRLPSLVDPLGEALALGSDGYVLTGEDVHARVVTAR